VGLVIDSCIFIGIERKKTAIDFSKLTELGEAYISSITASELLAGVHMAKD
jgi:tRNA(fMet)-specific endonuclease VapC